MMTTFQLNSYGSTSKKVNDYLKAIENSDNSGIKKIYEDFFSLTKQVIIKLGGRPEDAEDIFQEALIIILEKIKTNTFPQVKSFGAYLMGICKLLWKSNSRQKFRREVTGLSQDHRPGVDDMMEKLEAEDKTKCFRRKFKLLTEDQQKVMGLYFEGRSMKQIATEMGYGSAAYAKKKKAICKKKLVNMIRLDPLYQELSAA